MSWASEPVDRIDETCSCGATFKASGRSAYSSATAWRRDHRHDEKRAREAAGADLSASGADSDHGGRGDGEGLG